MRASRTHHPKRVVSRGGRGGWLRMRLLAAAAAFSPECVRRPRLSRRAWAHHLPCSCTAQSRLRARWCRIRVHSGDRRSRLRLMQGNCDSGRQRLHLGILQRHAGVRVVSVGGSLRHGSRGASQCLLGRGHSRSSQLHAPPELERVQVQRGVDAFQLGAHAADQRALARVRQPSSPRGGSTAAAAKA